MSRESMHGWPQRDPQIEAAYQRRLRLRDGRSYVMALAERYERNEMRRMQATPDQQPMVEEKKASDGASS